MFAVEPWEAPYLICNGLSTIVKLAIYCLEMVIAAGHPRSTLQPQLTLINQPIPKTTIGKIKAELCKPQKPLFLLSTKPMVTTSRVRDWSRISTRKGWVFSKLILVLTSLCDEPEYVAKEDGTATKRAERNSSWNDNTSNYLSGFVIFMFCATCNFVHNHQIFFVGLFDEAEHSGIMFFTWHLACDL